jgi:hypothetical protein
VIGCNKSQEQAPPRPNVQSQQPNYNAPGGNLPPQVGTVNPVTVSAGQQLTGVLTADDPNRAQGDSISKIEFTTNPPIAGFTNVQIPVGTGDRHNYNIMVPFSLTMSNTVGSFVVYDSRGASTSTSFYITFQNANGSGILTPGGTTANSVWCAALSQAVKLGGLWDTVLPVACNVVFRPSTP